MGWLVRQVVILTYQGCVWLLKLMVILTYRCKPTVKISIIIITNENENRR